MEVKFVEESQKFNWNQFVAQNPYGDVLQTWEWGEVKRSVVWEVIRVGVFNEGKIVGIAQILRRRLFKVFSLLYCPRGPVINWDQENSLEVLQALVEFVRKKIAKPLDLFLRIEPALINDKFQNPNKQSLRFSQSSKLNKSNSKFKIQNLGFISYFKSIQPKYTSIVDLSRGKDEIIASFEKDTRNSVHRAEREGVMVKKSEDLGGWQKFYQLYKETSIRGHFTPRPWSQFEKIYQVMRPQGQTDLYLAFLASAEPSAGGPLIEALLAGALILKIGSKAYYVWGASSREYPKKFAPYLLQWEIIKDLKTQGIISYDLWGIAPDDKPGHAWAGHTLFKKGFHGAMVNYIGCLDLPLSPFYRLFRLVDYLRQHFAQPDLIG